MPDPRRYGLLICAIAITPSMADAAPGVGTIDDPIRVDAFPYIVAGDTTRAVSNEIDSYACAPSLPQTGPEIVYAFQLDAPARVTAWVEGDTATVDIDVHLLTDLEVVDGEAVSCAFRADKIAEAEMSAGTHYVVVDTYAGPEQAGPFVLHLHAIGDAWFEMPVGEGVVWRARRFLDLSGPQVVHEIVADPTVAGVSMEVVAPPSCQTVATMAQAADPRPVAAVNSSFFASGCVSVSLMKSGGEILSTNGANRGSFALAADGAPMVAVIPSGADWPQAWDAQGGAGLLVSEGTAHQGSDHWAVEGLSAGFQGAHPRTWVGYEASGPLRFGTVDGRRLNAAGMSLDGLAAFVASSEVGVHGAVNLDGGGSTTMWVHAASPSGVANYPSDAGMVEHADHGGSRGVGGALFIHADPYNFPPRFQTDPLTSVQAGTTYLYEPHAIDLNVEDTITFELGEGPPGMMVDAQTGRTTYEATVESPPTVEVGIVARDSKGAATTQAYTLTIVGGMGPLDGSGTEGSDETTTSDPDPPGAGTTEDTGCERGACGPAGDEATSGGCSCRVESPAAGSWALVLLAIARPRRRRAVRAPARSRAAHGRVTDASKRAPARL
jgi:MYXO-CTERM domain-containing protein